MGFIAFSRLADQKSAHRNSFFWPFFGQIMTKYYFQTININVPYDYQQFCIQLLCFFGDFWSENLRFSASSVVKRDILRPKFEFFDNFLRYHGLVTIIMQIYGEKSTYFGWFRGFLEGGHIKPPPLLGMHSRCPYL